MAATPTISLNEFQHHIRNTLAVVRSLVRRSAQASTSLEQLAGAIDGRIGALGRAQAHLTRNPLHGADLESIVRDELLAHQIHVRGAVRIDGPTVQLEWKAAVTLGLAIHELVTNAIRYGALASSGGRLTILWDVTPVLDGSLRIRWSEIVPLGHLRVEPAGRGFGREYLEQTLAYDLDAEVSFDIGPEGLDCRIVLPLETVTV